jgi:cyanophycinase-like exopeptidase
MDQETKKWRKIADEGSVFDAALCFSDGHLFCVGGHEVHHDALSSFRIYDSFDDRWSEGPACSTARTSACTAVVGDRLVVCGGSGSAGRVTSVEAFDFQNR